MLYLIRSNTYFNYVLLLILTVAIRLPAFYRFTVDGVADYFMSSWLDNYLYRPTEFLLVTHLAASTLIVYITALVVNHWMVSHKMIERSGFLVAYCFVLIASALPVLQLCTSAFICNLLLLLLLGRFLRFIKQEEKRGDIFDMSLICGVMSLIYQPAVVFFVCLIFAVNTIKVLRLREYIVMLTGFAVPLFLVFTFLFVTDNLSSAFEIVKAYFTGYRFSTSINHSQIFMSVLVVLTTLAAVFKFQSDYNKSVVSFRKLMSVMLIMFVFGALGILLNRSVSGPHFILFSLPVALFLSYLFRDIKRPLVAEVVNGVLLVSVFISNVIFNG